MPPAYDLILEVNGDLLVRPIRASSQRDAWDLARRLHSGRVKGIVCRDGEEADAPLDSHS